MYNACEVMKGDERQSLCKHVFFSLTPKMGTWTNDGQFQVGKSKEILNTSSCFMYKSRD